MSPTTRPFGPTLTALAAALSLAASAQAAAPAAPAINTATSAPSATAASPAPRAMRLPGTPLPVFANADAVKTACDAGLAGAQARVAKLEKTSPGLPWLSAWDDLTDWTEDTSAALIFMQHVHPDKAIRSAAEACELRWQDFQSTLGLNERVYQGGVHTHLKDPIAQHVVQVALEGFEDSGVSLPAADRPKAKALSDRITELGQQFARTIRDAHVQVAYTVDELKGVPEGVWKDAKRDADGKVLLGVEYPVYYPVLTYAQSAAVRERIWRAKTNEGTEANLKVIAELAQLRRDYAKLFGFNSYDDFVLRRRMVGSTARANKFLDDVQAAVRVGETKDVDELRTAKARLEGTPLDKTTMPRWDQLYYTEIVKKEKYTFDAEAFRAYFPPQESLKFVMRVAEKMFDIHYERVPGTFWHPDVQAYAVIDNKTHQPISSLYVDLFPRDGKYTHAACWGLISSAAPRHRLPQAALVVNFDRNGLTLSELETLLHEFGHSLHADLGKMHWSSGGAGIQRDFVEAPSQMLEDWVYDPKVLAVFKEVCPSCKAVPADLLDKARAARDYGKGLRFARQHLYATYDLAVHGAEAVDPMSTWAKMEGATPLGYVPGTLFPAGFAHIAGGGYASGYYGYLWSLVVAMDLRTAFAADKLSPVVGDRYRRTVLAPGGEKPANELVHDFLGRDVSSKPFFDYMAK